MNRYELSFLFQGRIHFAIVRAENVRSAAERTICEPAVGMSFVQSGETGNWFVTDKEGTRWCISESPEYELQSEVVPSCKPHHSELPRTPTPVNVDTILAQLL